MGWAATQANLEKAQQDQKCCYNRGMRPCFFAPGAQVLASNATLPNPTEIPGSAPLSFYDSILGP